ncbi:MAG: holo-ACP synthase [Acidimicrobiales bacterium]
MATVSVVGTGVDVVDVERFRRVLTRRPQVARRIFTDAEREYATRKADPAPSLAARFAAKEATMKALGVGLGAFRLRDAEVVRTSSGEPWLRLTGGAAALAARRGAARFHLSLTHSALTAIAFVVAESE